MSHIWLFKFHKNQVKLKIQFLIHTSYISCAQESHVVSGYHIGQNKLYKTHPSLQKILLGNTNKYSLSLRNHLELFLMKLNWMNHSSWSLVHADSLLFDLVISKEVLMSNHKSNLLLLQVQHWHYLSSPFVLLAQS